MSRCLMQDLRAFRMAVVLQMRGGVLKRCHLRLFLVVVLRLRYRSLEPSFFVCVSFEGRQLFLKGLTVMALSVAAGICQLSR